MGTVTLKATKTILSMIVSHSINIMQDKLLFQFAVIADTHIRLLDSAEEGGYPTNRLSNDRAKNIVQCLNRIKTESDSSRQFGPEYSELQVVAPGEEFGRNDTAKLGSFIVKVFTVRHEIVQSEHMEKLVSIRK